MTATPGADERRARHNLLRVLDGGAPTPARTRDWLDDLWDDEPKPKPEPPGPPPPSRAAPPAAGDGERRWDLRRLLHWPYIRPAVGAVVALVPWFGGYSAATRWGAVLTQARAEAGIGAAWVIAGVGFGTAAVLVNRRRGWPSYGLLTCAFIGTVAMASPFDIVTFMTGVTQ